MKTKLTVELTLGTIAPDPIDRLLQTGYMLFSSPMGIKGLFKENDDRLDLLMVETDAPGCGQFRRFIQQAKRDFKTICIWEIWNPWLESVLIRYGFCPQVEIDGRTGDVLTGMRWDKP